MPLNFKYFVKGRFQELILYRYFEEEPDEETDDASRGSYTTHELEHCVELGESILLNVRSMSGASGGMPMANVESKHIKFLNLTTIRNNLAKSAAITLKSFRKYRWKSLHFYPLGFSKNGVFAYIESLPKIKGRLKVVNLLTDKIVQSIELNSTEDLKVSPQAKKVLEKYKIDLNRGFEGSKNSEMLGAVRYNDRLFLYGSECPLKYNLYCSDKVCEKKYPKDCQSGLLKKEYFFIFNNKKNSWKKISDAFWKSQGKQKATEIVAVFLSPFEPRIVSLFGKVKSNNNYGIIPVGTHLEIGFGQFKR